MSFSITKIGNRTEVAKELNEMPIQDGLGCVARDFLVRALGETKQQEDVIVKLSGHSDERYENLQLSIETVFRSS